MEAFASSIPDKLTALWNYSAAAETEAKFLALLDEAITTAGVTRLSTTPVITQAVELGSTHPQILELLTQIARAQGLQRKFDEAHATLDAVFSASESPVDRTTVPPVKTRASVRYLLERGRVFNSSKQRETALPLFVAAYEVGLACSEEDLAIDAAHMVAIAEPSADKQTEWNLLALSKAEAATDPKARKWIGSLTNNLGWTFHDAGKFAEALTLFEKALKFREEAGELKSRIIAKWCVARCLRSVGRIDEALTIQQELAVENEKLDAPDGYNSEELGELLLLQGKHDEARSHFKRAVELLSADAWFVENEKTRLERLQQLAQ